MSSWDRIQKNLDRHKQLMDRLIIKGMSKIEASAEALRIMETTNEVLKESADERLQRRVEKHHRLAEQCKAILDKENR